MFYCSEYPLIEEEKKLAMNLYSKIVKLHRFVCVVATFMILQIDGEELESVSYRGLQTNQIYNYRATYKAEFSHYREAFCYGDPPLLEVSCHGSGKVLNTSDPSIICNQASTAKVENGTTFQCQNTCNGTFCDSIYLRASFGAIEFMCEGNDYRQVNAQYLYLGGNDGSCEASSETTALNAHLGRLGVSCPVDNGRTYLFDDTFFECSSNDVLDLSDENEEDIYSCYSGKDCEGLSCTVTFRDISLESTISSFLDTCVESTGDVTSFPSITPKVGATGIKSTFEASWARFYDSDAAKDMCSSESPLVTITCGNGASIVYLNSSDPTMVCTNFNATDLTCLGNAELSNNNYTRVYYECVGLVTPTSRVVYPESYVSCVGNIFEIIVRNTVTLGVFCDIRGDQYYSYEDLFVECGEPEHNFEIYDSDRYTCSESSNFELGSTASQTIRNVTIMTDGAWLEKPSGCVFSADIIPTPVAPTIATPVSSPTMSNPTISPATSPMMPEMNTPTLQNRPTADDPRVPMETSSEDSSILGIAIGCVGGGFALAAVVGLVIFLRKCDRGGGAPNAKTAISQHFHTESNNDDDYTSSIPTYSTSTAPTYAAIANISQPSQHRTSSAESGHVNATAQIQTENVTSTRPAFRSSPTRNSASIKLSNRSSSNYVVDVKDQCRSVVVRATSPSPLSRVSAQGENIPFAVAVGVSTVSSVSSKQSSQKEPPGRISVDP